MHKNQHFHFMGIGGIGMSAIALILKKNGHTVSGCDLDINSFNCTTLRNLGCTLFQGHSSAGCYDESISTLIYTTMINSDHPELIAAQNRAIECLHRSEMLGILTQKKPTIAVAGSHGKTTTSALVSHIFFKAQQEPSIIIGGNLTTINGNAYKGDGNLLIIEADESDRSFLNLFPTYEIITNISFEHVETYTSLQDIKTTFYNFMDKVPEQGFIIACYDDKNIQEIIKDLPHKVITYGFDSRADWHITHHTLNADNSIFSLKYKDLHYENITTSLLGSHNILNSAAAFIMGHMHEIAEKDIRTGLATFPGVDRRFTYKGVTSTGAKVFDDYGHHPKEIVATFKIAQNKPHNKLIVVFQPHRYTRMAGLWDEFIALFTTLQIDELIITDIHSAYEKPIEGITSQQLVQELKIKNPSLNVCYIPLDSTFDTLTHKVLESTTTNDVLLVQGAGKITDFAAHIVVK